MPYKLVIYRKVIDEKAQKVTRSPLRNVQVHDTFNGIDRFGKPIHSEFMTLAHELEKGEKNLSIDILSL